MTRTKLLIGFALAAAMLGAVHAAEDSSMAVEAAPTSTCPKEHSLALCIAKAAHVAGAMRDAVAIGAGNDMGNRTGDALWYAGAAAGSGTKFFRQAKGVSRGAEVGMFLVGMVASMASGSDIVGRNMVLAWMPAEMASTKEEANAKAAAVLLQATLASFEGSAITAEAIAGVQGVSRYRIAGGVCDGHDCVLMPPLKGGDSGPVLGARSFKRKAPDFLGGGESYSFGTRLGALYAWKLMVDGKEQTHAYLPELSKRMPEWMYVVSSPETRLADGSLFNEGQRAPVMYHAGEALFFAFPESAQAPLSESVAAVR